MSKMFQYFLYLFLSKRIEKIKFAKVGMIIKPITNAESMVKVLVKASGLNNFPSAASIAKTGRKLTMVVARAVITAPATSTVASYTVFSKCFPLAPMFSGISRCRMIFSVNTTPTSTITPMAMAMPDKATILASTPNCRMVIKVINTPMGNKLEIRKEARRFNTRTITTRILISSSNVMASSRVPRVSLIRPVRS